jgi:hypothetical protein
VSKDTVNFCVFFLKSNIKGDYMAEYPFDEAPRPEDDIDDDLIEEEDDDGNPLIRTPQTDDEPYEDDVYDEDDYDDKDEEDEDDFDEDDEDDFNEGEGNFK